MPNTGERFHTQTELCKWVRDLLAAQEVPLSSLLDNGAPSSRGNHINALIEGDVVAGYQLRLVFQGAPDEKSIAVFQSIADTKNTGGGGFGLGQPEAFVDGKGRHGVQIEFPRLAGLEGALMHYAVQNQVSDEIQR